MGGPTPQALGPLACLCSDGALHVLLSLPLADRVELSAASPSAGPSPASQVKVPMEAVAEALLRRCELQVRHKERIIKGAFLISLGLDTPAGLHTATQRAMKEAASLWAHNLLLGEHCFQESVWVAVSDGSRFTAVTYTGERLPVSRASEDFGVMQAADFRGTFTRSPVFTLWELDAGDGGGSRGGGGGGEPRPQQLPPQRFRPHAGSQEAVSELLGLLGAPDWGTPEELEQLLAAQRARADAEGAAELERFMRNAGSPPRSDDDGGDKDGCSSAGGGAGAKRRRHEDSDSEEAEGAAPAPAE